LFAAFLRDPPWLTPDRLRAYVTILLLAGAAMTAWTLAGPGLADPMGRPIGTDFLSFWTVSWALLHGQAHAIYHPQALARLEQAMVHPAHTALYAWEYPPTALLIVYPLAPLPYLWSLALWLAVGGAVYLTALWRILPRMLTLWAGLAYPAVLLTIGHGQNALLTTGLLGWGLLLLPRRPVAAGILFGILSFKPQLALLVPVALIAAGQWRTIAAASFILLVLALRTIILFGSSVWAGFRASLPFAGQIIESGLVPYYKFQSAFAAMRLLGAVPAIAWSVQTVATLGSAAIVIWRWRHSTDAMIRNAALAAAIPLASPFFLDYDLVVLALAMAWLARIQQRKGVRPWERTVLAVNAMTPLVSRTIGAYTHVLLAPLAIAALLVVIALRARGDRFGHAAAGLSA
jgi:alpha-1,2-mannosyltransferase